MTLTQNDIDEVKAYYRDEALKYRNKQYRRFALDFLDMLDIVYHMQQPHFDRANYTLTNSQYYNDTAKLRRAMSMIERYFKMKERGAL
jgi:hypothetical protein